MHSFEHASAFVHAIGAAGAIVDFRAIHDTNKGIPAIPFRDTLENAWSSIVHYNSQGYGIFAVIAALDGAGRNLANVQHIRAHYVDLDNVSAQANLDRSNQWFPRPSFGVASSPGKFHVYWPVAPYASNDRFELVQRKLRQLFDGDGTIIDATRVMRLPGTLHLKDPSKPHLVQCFAMGGAGTTVEQLEQQLAPVNVIAGVGSRHELGDPALAAPSIDLAVKVLHERDPNSLTRADWISRTAAFKQAVWTLADENTIYQTWLAWCARYEHDDIPENHKQWHSIRNTEVGWNYIAKSSALAKLGEGGNVPTQQPVQPQPQPQGLQQTPDGALIPPPPSTDGEMLTSQEQQIWFKDCILVEALGEILTPNGRYMNSTKFNAAYGGKKFIIDGQGKVTNEPWQAATRSTMWTIPKVDHIRFLPARTPGEHIEDDRGRLGLNVYKPARIERREGDPAPFLQWLQRVLPVESDRKTILDFLAHNVKFPGYKIPWAPVIQSVEGVGKGMIKLAMEHAMGYSYTYFPNAKELAEGGGKFNAWMRNKLFILADEIKVDDTRDMIEVLKPMISEESIEIQGKGQDQDKEDNFSNWAFFTNWQNAVPISRHGRRFSVFYSALQSVDDLHDLGMNDAYFNWLYAWLKHAGGKQIVANWLLNYPIEFGQIPMRAPRTSSTDEALKKSRGPLEQIIADAIEDGLQGFRGGWVSSLACMKLLAGKGGRNVSPRTIQTILEGMQYHERGRAPRAYMAEDPKTRATVYHLDRNAAVEWFAPMQGYEVG